LIQGRSLSAPYGWRTQIPTDKFESSCTHLEAPITDVRTQLQTKVAPLDFNGRVAIVTGAARGLGRAVAERLYERGAAVAINVRDATRADALSASLGDRALSVPGDIAAAGMPDEIVRRTLDRFGRIDILINNAAFARSTRFPCPATSPPLVCRTRSSAARSIASVASTF